MILPIDLKICLKIYTRNLISIWIILNTKNFKQAIIGAINLGDDTDTVGAVTGSIAGVLYGYTPQKIIKTKKNEKYRNEVDNFVKILSDKKSQFKKLNDELRKCQIDIKRLKEDAHNDGFDIKDNALEKIVNDKKSKFMLYLREIATKIIEEEKNIENDKEEKINKLANYFMLQRTKNYMNNINKIKDSYNFMII